MRRLVAPVSIVAAIVLGGCQSGPATQKTEEASPASAVQTPVQRGEYLVKVIGCNDCHTPMSLGPRGPEYDQTHYLAGHPAGLELPPPPENAGPWWMSTNMTAFAGPWGISYAANITPDSLTGIGIWTEEMFMAALRTGRHMGTSRPILPPMPWPSFAQLTDSDLRAVYAYLRTIPAVHNPIPEPVIAPPPPGAPSGGTD